jgi:hypothetical protein
MEGVGEDADYHYLNITAENGYLKRLVHQTIRSEYTNILQTEGRGAFVQITRVTPESLLRRKNQQTTKQIGMEKHLSQDVGLRRVIDLLFECGKPLIGHQVWMDLMFLVATFTQVPFPPHLDEFKRLMQRYYPTCLDTKCILSHHPLLRDTFTVETLEGLMLYTTFVDKVAIHLDDAHQRYMYSESLHEAGYDAYCTGVVFLRLAFLVSEAGTRLLEGDGQLSTDLVQRLNGKLHVHRTQDATLDLYSPVQVHYNHINVLHIQTMVQEREIDNKLSPVLDVPFGLQRAGPDAWWLVLGHITGALVDSTPYLSLVQQSLSGAVVKAHMDIQ